MSTPSHSLRFRALAATPDVDSESIRFARGAWRSGFPEAKARGWWPGAPLLWNHCVKIGRVLSLDEDERGLIVVGELFEETSTQRWVLAEVRDHARQIKLSTGHKVLAEHRDGEVRVVDSAAAKEVSLLHHARNPRTRILELIEAPTGSGLAGMVDALEDLRRNLDELVS